MFPLIYAKVQQAVWVFIENVRKTQFSFLLLLKRKCINQKKLNVKTLSRPYIKRTHQSYQLLPGHLGILRTQTEGVRLGI